MIAKPEPFVAILIPVYNEELMVADVLTRLLDVRSDRDWEIIVVDDASTDRTAETLGSFGDRIRVIRHPVNLGYGAALKTGIRATRAANVIFLDSDGQHDPALVPAVVERLRDHEFVIGTRKNQEGVPAVRRPGKLVLRLVVSFLAGRSIEDVNYGFRGGRRVLYLRMLDLLPDGFSFSTTSLVYVLKSRFSVSFMEMPSRARTGVSTVRIVRDGLTTLLLALRLIMLFDPLRAFMVPSLVLILTGVAYQGYVLTYMRFRIVGGALLCILGGIILFHFALLADQIAAMRKELSSQHSLLWEEHERRDT